MQSEPYMVIGLGVLFKKGSILIFTGRISGGGIGGEPGLPGEPVPSVYKNMVLVAVLFVFPAVSFTVALM